ncbi:outer membrane beta-barrel protein [Pseudoalteromonas fenneropenaei]|uniref:Outer membrane beta-barrel protein n=1 Tax=Pseudoalteromonas fenneropenaei TaxID=1737459 RepID=A0ABV7CLR7_9GAMM
MKKAILPLIFVSFGAFATSATAQTNPQALEPFSIYAGIGYGQYALQWQDREKDMEFDDDAAMLKAYVGTHITPYWSIELGYENFDEASDIDNYAEFDGISLATRFTAPITEQFGVYAKGGWFEWDGELYADVPGLGRVSRSADGGDWFYGAGVSYAFTTNVSMRLEYLRYELEDHIEPDLDVASVSVEYVF